MNSNNNILFAESPFTIVADPSIASCWSGRPKVHESLIRLTQSLVRRPDSSLDIMWANLGAGKTHTLFHLAYLLGEQSTKPPNVNCAFVEMPEQIKNFLDLYRRIVASLPLDRVAELLSQCPKGVLPDNVSRAANVLRNGGPSEKEIVTNWILGERPYLAELRRCSGISQRIEDDLAATDVLSAIVHAFDRNKVRLVILIDEFQRIGVLKSGPRGRVLSCLRTVFSRSPRFLSVVLAIQSMVEQTALELIPPELRTLVGRKPAISLPEMDLPEAREFLCGRFSFFRPKEYSGTPTAPFDDEAVSAILQYLKEQAHVPLSPREILQAFAYVYDQAVDLEKGIGDAEAIDLLGAGYAEEN